MAIVFSDIVGQLPSSGKYVHFLYLHCSGSSRDLVFYFPFSQVQPIISSSFFHEIDDKCCYISGAVKHKLWVYDRPNAFKHTMAYYNCQSLMIVDRGWTTQSTFIFYPSFQLPFQFLHSKAIYNSVEFYLFPYRYWLFVKNRIIDILYNLNEYVQ